MLPLSLMPTVRLKRLSTRSPKVPNTTTTSPKPSHTGSVRTLPTSLPPVKYHTMAAAISTKIPPPMLPSQLLAGETRGNNLCLPKREPQQYAPVSLTQRKMKTLNGNIVLNAIVPSPCCMKARAFIVENGRAIYICESIV